MHSANGPLLAPVGARITGIGAARPSVVLSGSRLTEPFGKTAEWLMQRTGIAQVHRLGAHETLLDLCLTAGRAALRNAEVPATAWRP